MVELADTLDLGSSGKPCRFESCCPHQRRSKLRTAQKRQALDASAFSSTVLPGCFACITPQTAHRIIT